MRSHKNIIIWIIFILIHISLLAPFSTLADAPKKIAILPLNMNTDGNLIFLKEGIMDMMRSRLAVDGKLELVEKGIVKKTAEQVKAPITKEGALVVGKALGTEFVVLINMTVLGEVISFDTRVLDIANGGEIFSVLKQSKGFDEVTSTVNQIAFDIRARIIGGEVRPDAPLTQGTNELIKKEVRPDEIALEKMEIGSTQNLPTGILGMASGDVDNDGKIELVLIDTDTVYVYRWAGKTFALIKSIKNTGYSENVFVSVADLDDNGFAEIYVSSQYKAGFSSFVLEWRSNTLETLVKGERLLIRVIDLPGKGETLVGQERTTTGFASYVYTLKREGKHLVKQERLVLPFTANALNFVKGPIVDKESQDTLILLADSDILFLYDAKGEEIWRSKVAFGGVYTHFVSIDLPGDEKWIYFSSPIILCDLNSDGRREVLLCKNISGTGRIVDKFKMYSEGTVNLLAWDGQGMSSRWESKKMSGPLTGYCLADVDMDGRPELVLSVLTQAEGIFKKAKSQLVVYRLVR